MPPPPSFITITSIPFSRVVTQAEFNGGVFGGIANEVWFKFPSTGTAKLALGSFCNKGGTFVPQTQLYDSDGTTILHAFVNGDKGWYQIVDATTDKYIKIVKTTGGASNFDFTVQFDTRVVNAVTIPSNGDILVNDDTGGPAYMMDSLGVFKTFLDPFSSGEYGDKLPDNFSLWDGDAHGAFRFEIYNTLTFDSSVNIVGEHLIIASNTDFFLVKRVAPHNAYKITELGVVTALGTLPASAIKITGLGVNLAGTILYWGRQSGDSTIHRWDTTTGLPLSDFYTIPGYDVVSDRFATTNFNNGARTITLPDDSVVFFWFDASIPSHFIVHLSSSGTLINSWSQSPLGVNHLAKIKDSTDSIKVWYIDSLGAGTLSTYSTYNITTGIATLSTPALQFFESGDNATNSDGIMFGPAGSCIFVVFVSEIPPPPLLNPGSGIYKIVPGKRQDTLWDEDFNGTHDVKIPNPFAKSALLGE